MPHLAISDGLTIFFALLENSPKWTISMVTVYMSKNILLLQKMLAHMSRELIKPLVGESLERLQLVQMDLENYSHEKEWQIDFDSIQIERNNDARFLFLRGNIFDEEKNLCQIKIKYFLRGEKKYFQNTLENSCEKIIQEIFPPNEKEIEKLFSQLNLSNQFFLNQKLNLLLGRTKIFVPTQNFLQIIFETIFADKKFLDKKNIRIKFFNNLELDEKIIVKADEKNDWSISFEQNEKICASVNAD